MDGVSIEQYLNEKFKNIVGQQKLKQQVLRFARTAYLNNIRNPNKANNGAVPMYHMTIMGNPGTGKTTVAKLIADILIKLNVLNSTAKFLHIENPLELLGTYAGQTPDKIDKKFAPYMGGVILIDEAYSLTTNIKQSSFSQEAIDTIMKYMLPAKAVFIFAGYKNEMQNFIEANAGLARRITYKFTFDAYTHDELVQILLNQCEQRHITIADRNYTLPYLRHMIQSIPRSVIDNQNAGLITNWMDRAESERDNRLTINIAKPEFEHLQLQLCLSDFRAGLLLLFENM